MSDSGEHRRVLAAERLGWRRGSGSVRVHLALVVLGSTLMIGVALSYGFSWAADQARSHAHESMAAQTELAARSLAIAVEAAQQQVASVARQPGIEAVLARPENCTLVAGGDGVLGEVRIDILNADGDVVCSSAPGLVDAVGAEHAGSAWLTHLADGPATSWGITDATTGQPSLVVMHPFGGGAGAVAVFGDVSGLASRMYAGQAMPEASALTVVNAGSRLVVSASGARGAAQIGRQAQDERASGTWVGVDGVQRVFASAQVPDSPLRIYGGVEDAAVVADARGLLGRQAVVGALALMALVVSAGFFDRRIVRPLRALTAAVREAQLSTSGVRVDDQGGAAELATLAREFNSMLDVRAAHEARLAHHATHDRVTGLPTLDLVVKDLERAMQDVVPSVGLLSVGLIRFQPLTDTLGPDAAARVLAEVSERLHEGARDGDTVARTGPHEFMILGLGLSQAEAEALADRIGLSLARPVAGNTTGGGVRVAVGITVGSPSVGAATLVREATTAMGRARADAAPWVVFDASMQDRATSILEIERDLRSAVVNAQLEVHYQPLVRTRTGTIVGAEALVRWRHPTRGLIPPSAFIPIAEESGQIGAIGEFVLGRACAHGATWVADGLQLRISVNVAAEQLDDPAFPGTVQATLASTGLAPASLCLEITESAMVSRAPAAAGALDVLRQMGVAVAIDDFGTGYSSLAYLKDLPVDVVKIDRSFVAQIGRDSRDTHLVAAVVAMARALDLAVVAEGVETVDQQSILANLGCSLAQGYLFAQPQAPEAFRRLLNAQVARQRLVVTKSA